MTPHDSKLGQYLGRISDEEQTRIDRITALDPYERSVALAVSMHRLEAKIDCIAETLTKKRALGELVQATGPLGVVGLAVYIAAQALGYVP